MLRLLRSTDYGALLNLVSPKFFEVLPGSALKSEIGSLARGLRNTKKFNGLLEDRRDPLASMRVDLVDSTKSDEVEDVGTYGQSLLELYFWQLFACDTTLLDLRSSRMAEANQRLQWRPSRIYTVWEDEFIASIRLLYESFYSGNDANLDRALESLNLGDAKHLFIEHFGGQQTEVRFELDRFQGVFHRVFVKTREASKQLHPNFISFGVYLGTLYENLSRFEHAFDVRAAFESVQAKVNTSSQVSGLSEHATQSVE